MSLFVICRIQGRGVVGLAAGILHLLCCIFLHWNRLLPNVRAKEGGNFFLHWNRLPNDPCILPTLFRILSAEFFSVQAVGSSASSWEARRGKGKVGQLKYNAGWRQENMFLGNIFIFGKLGFHNIVELRFEVKWLGHPKSHQQCNIGNFEACLRVQHRFNLS